MKTSIKEVIIVGFGATRGYCPYHIETWGCNDFYRTEAKRIDKIFITDRINPREFRYEDLEKITKDGIQIVASLPYKDHPEWKVEPYPINEIIKKFNTRFFSNSFCYMIAYALYYKYKKIWLYGVEPMAITYIINEDPGVEYWLGIAKALGTELISPCERVAMTYNNLMYGYWGDRVKDITCREI